MASKLLSDELWNEIEPLFPQYEPSPEGGCPPKEARGVLTVILFVLKTGIGWKDLPTEAFGCSYKTCLRRIQEWSRLGLSRTDDDRPDRLALLGELRHAIERDELLAALPAQAGPARRRAGRRRGPGALAASAARVPAAE